MQALALHFDFSRHPLPGDPDMSRFRHDLAVSLEKVLRGSGNGRWRGEQAEEPEARFRNH